MSGEPGRSGLRDPARAVRGTGAVALLAQALVLLLAIQPMRVLGVPLHSAAVVSMLVLALVCVVLAGLLSRGWAWYAALAPQAALIVGGFVVHPSLAAVGVLFGLVWLYVLRVRRSVLR